MKRTRGKVTNEKSYLRTILSVMSVKTGLSRRPLTLQINQKVNRLVSSFYYSFFLRVVLDLQVVHELLVNHRAPSISTINFNLCDDDELVR